MDHHYTKKSTPLSPKKLFPILLLLFLAIVIPILIFAAKSVQDIRQRAYEPTSTFLPSPTPCSPRDPSSCPTGYTCIQATISPCTGDNCPNLMPGSSRCVPTATSPTPTTSPWPQTCSVGDPNSCPRGYTCVQPSPPTTCTGNNCPSLMPALPRCVPETAPTSQACNPADPNSCPAGFTCKKATIQCFTAPCPTTSIATCVPSTITTTPPPATPSPSTSITPTITLGRGCKLVGCNNELCRNSTDFSNTGSICLWRPQYACLKYSRCEKQPDGNCDWTKTTQYQQCLSNIPPSPTVTGDPLLRRADINRDFIVDLSDYSLLVRDFLKTGTGLPADINQDNLVDISDYSLLVKYFLKTVPR